MVISYNVSSGFIGINDQSYVVMEIRMVMQHLNDIPNQMTKLYFGKHRAVDPSILEEFSGDHRQTIRFLDDQIH